MIEGQAAQESQIFRFTDLHAAHYAQRLMDLTELRNEIDRANYPFTFWQGEDGDAVNVREITGIKNPMTGKPQRGLRHAVLEGIFGSWRWLVQNGHEDVANSLIQFDRDRQKGPDGTGTNS